MVMIAVAKRTIRENAIVVGHFHQAILNANVVHEEEVDHQHFQILISRSVLIFLDFLVSCHSLLADL